MQACKESAVANLSHYLWQKATPASQHGIKLLSHLMMAAIMLLDVLSIGLLARSAANQVRPLQEDAAQLKFG